MINKAFTVSMADVEHVAACDYVGLVSKRNEPNKMEIAGFHTTKSEFVNAPVIDELPLVMEEFRITLPLPSQKTVTEKTRFHDGLERQVSLFGQA